MLICLSPPSFQVLESTAEIPLLPGSDPLILETYKWTLIHSPSLQQVVRQLALADRKARYRLIPGLDLNYGRIVIHPTAEEYHVDIQVPITAWVRCGDALEPWIASALFLTLEIATKGAIRNTSDSYRLTFYKKSKRAAFDFPKKVREEITLADPIRLKNMPDGLDLFESAFHPKNEALPPAKRRALPLSKP